MFQHIKNGINITCPHRNCKKSKTVYKTISQLKSHIYRKHHSNKEVYHDTNLVIDVTSPLCEDPQVDIIMLNQLQISTIVRTTLIV
jgi:hypothetical protein